ncbi:hypothetical protein QBC40DRAFT_330878 [Triangularia verruculosa]|uniref:Uncharacterized protein n=1 Tax=Triangularia verruculosa TaxID=2587418 RepID=A0AAN7AX26_9PEZI|nr:hypothetical protein QBC40DRAFT_330878 [Triangularia verruculosa]
MKRKHPDRPLPSTSLSALSSLYRDAEPMSKKPRVEETQQYTRSNRRTRDFPKMERRITRSQSSSRSRSPTNTGIEDQIEVAWWDARVTESSASSNGKVSAKLASTRFMTRSPRVVAPKKAKVNRDSLTEEDMVDGHDPRISEDYVPFSPPLAKEKTRERSKRASEVNDESKEAEPPSITGSIQDAEILMAAGDCTPFYPDSPAATRQNQNVNSPGHESSLLANQYDGAATDAVDEQTPAPHTNEELSATGSDAPPSHTPELETRTVVPPTQEAMTKAGLGANPPPLRANSDIWNPVLLTAKDGGGRFGRLWPARKGGVYCEACFRDECIRWIRIRDKVVGVSRLLGGDEALLTNDAKFPRSIIWPDQMNDRVNNFFRKSPSDMIGLALLRVLAAKRVATLDRKSQDEVMETLRSLCRDIGASEGHLARIERQCETLIETSGVAQAEQKGAIPKNVAWLWEFDSLLQAAERKFSIERFIGSYFATTLTLRAREAAITEIWARSVVARGGTVNNMLNKIEKSIGLQLKNDALLSSIGEAVAEASSKSEQVKEGRDGTLNVIPCQYCAESEVVNVRGSRNSKSQVTPDYAWIRPLIWAFEKTVETASTTLAEEFFHLVESRGAATAELPGIKFLVDSTGGERRIVLVEIASVFDTVWKEL